LISLKILPEDFWSSLLPEHKNPSYWLKLALCLILLLSLTACSPQPIIPAALPVPEKAVTLKSLMVDIIDPAADGVWNAVSTTITQAGIEEHQPQNDQEWAQVRLSALSLINAADYLGKTRLPVAAPGTQSEHPGIEESPEAIQQLIASQPQLFAGFAQQLRSRTEAALAAIDSKNPAALLEVGGHIDEICEACHKTFWYPHQFKNRS